MRGAFPIDSLQSAGALLPWSSEWCGRTSPALARPFLSEPQGLPASPHPQCGNAAPSPPCVARSPKRSTAHALAPATSINKTLTRKAEINLTLRPCAARCCLRRRYGETLSVKLRKARGLRAESKQRRGSENDAYWRMPGRIRCPTATLLVDSTARRGPATALFPRFRAPLARPALLSPHRRIAKHPRPGYVDVVIIC